MNTFRKIIISLVSLSGIFLLSLSLIISKPKEIEIDDIEIPQGSTLVAINEIFSDTRVIPDDYNTGCNESILTKVSEAGYYDNLQFKYASDNSKLVLEFFYTNKQFSGEVVVNNMDFSKYPMSFYDEKKVDRNIHVTFNNCKFKTLNTTEAATLMSYTFNNCTFNRFVGSNATFNKCKFGSSYIDGLNLFTNVSVNDCYFRDFNHILPQGNEHVDGVQTYGKAGIDVENISFTNCRFEIPAIQNEQNCAKINSCIMLQVEYSSGHNITFTDCIINGGGYSIYAWAKKEPYTLEATLKNIRVGGANIFGTLYPKVSDSVVFDNVTETDSLYVSSTWKDEDGLVHLIVTNDTCDERILRIYYSESEYKEYNIKACLGGKELRYYPDKLSYSDFPFDIEIILDVDCDWVVCYDATEQGFSNFKQIRTVNFNDTIIKLAIEEESEEEIIVEETVEAPAILDDSNNSINDQKMIVASGVCGDNIIYYLDNAGLLMLEGKGATYNFSANKRSPWYAINKDIKDIYIGDDITILGDQLFDSCSNAVSLRFPESITEIKRNVFIRCSSLTNITLPPNLYTIDSYAFAGTTSLSEVTCDAEQWEKISIGKGNDILQNKVVLTYPVINNSNSSSISGMCGDNVYYNLNTEGQLVLSGTGTTYSYRSDNRSPWYEVRDKVISITIEDGITLLGDQLFDSCKNAILLSLPQTLTEIGRNVFIRCSSLSEINLPINLLKIGGYAFNGLNSLNVVTCDADQWNNLNIASGNDILYNKIITTSAYSDVIDINTSTLSGMCGDNIYYNLDIYGNLTLSGTGDTYSYRSDNRSPWYEERDKITSITIEEGITLLGDQLFDSCKNASSLTLPQSLTEIKRNVFIRCSSLSEINLPNNLYTIGGYSFNGITSLEAVICNENQWNNMSIGNGNDILYNKIVFK